MSTTMQTMQIDIVSDVACPWCAIGYKRLQQAMRELDGELTFELEWRPFELQPGMENEGEEILGALCRKYGRGEAEMRAAQDEIIAAAEALGLNFDRARERRVHNTFDAHRMLEWAREHGCQTELKLALFEAYFGKAENPSDPAVLRGIAESLGLDGAAVNAILGSDQYAQTVRDQERRYRQAGVSAVPTFVVNGRHMIPGAQEPTVLVHALRNIAARSEVA